MLIDEYFHWISLEISSIYCKYLVKQRVSKDKITHSYSWDNSLCIIEREYEEDFPCSVVMKRSRHDVLGIWGNCTDRQVEFSIEWEFVEWDSYNPLRKEKILFCFC